MTQETEDSIAPHIKRSLWGILALMLVSVIGIVLSFIWGNPVYGIGIILGWGVIGIAFSYIMYRANKDLNEYVGEFILIRDVALNDRKVTMNHEKRNKNVVNENTYSSIESIVEKREIVKFNNMVKILAINVAFPCALYYLCINVNPSRLEKKHLIELFLFSRSVSEEVPMTTQEMAYFFSVIKPKWIPISVFLLYFVLKLVMTDDA